MAKIHRYTMAHAKRHLGKLYNEQIRELVDQAYNEVEDR